LDRGRGRGRGRRWDLGRPGVPQDLPPQQPFGPPIDSINIKTLLIEEDAPTIKDVKYAASYNWLDGKYPVILIPGSALHLYYVDSMRIEHSLIP
jgi:hypothetical protein